MVRFIPAQELKETYDVLGHFYSVHVTSKVVVECRSVLELVAKTHTPANVSRVSSLRPDAVFIMMNPGSSQPLVDVNNGIQAANIHKLAVSLVPTKPDTTQYQVMRVMHYCGWRHVRVLNLSDLRCSKSVEFVKQFRRLEADASYDAHSLFSSRRHQELTAKLTGHRDVPVVRAWGVSPDLDPLIERCLLKLAGTRSVMGLMKEGTTDKFLHPLPSLQSQKLQWVNRMVEQCR